MADWLTVPPLPEQLSANVKSLVIAPVGFEPLVASDPVQAPVPLHALVFVLDQLIVVVFPRVTVLGLALIVTVGVPEVAAPPVTVTVAVLLAVPSGPVHVSVKVSFAFRCAVFFESASGLTPVQLPVPTHWVALVLDQVIRDCSPAVTKTGLATILTVGALAAIVTRLTAIKARRHRSIPKC